MNTTPEEFIKFLKLLPKTPILIPILANSKLPDIPKGESWKDEKHYLTPERAIKRLENGDLSFKFGKAQEEHWIPVEMFITLGAIVRIRCLSRSCNHWNTFK